MRSGARAASLVGRDQDLAILSACWRSAVDEEQPALVVIRGEAGIGKTRLVDAVASHVTSDGGRVLVGGCVPMFGATMLLAPLRQAFRPLMTGSTAAGAALSGHDASGFTQADTGQLFGELAEVLAASAPLLLVVEDVHWADRLTLGFLTFLDRWLRARPAGVVAIATCRPDEAGGDLADWLAEQVRSPLTTLVEPKPLAPSEVGQLLGELTGKTASPATIALVAERSDGLPFYIEELAAADFAGVPVGARDSLAHRIAGLAAASRAVVDAASVLGKRVSHTVLERVAALPEDVLTEGLRGSIAGRVLVADGDGYRFRHALLAEFVYAELLAGPRQTLHARAATALDENGALPAEIAGHAIHSGDAERALAWSMRAGDAAAQLQAHREAAHWYRAALEVWDGVPNAEKVAGGDYAEVLFRLGRDERWTDQPRRAVETLHRALSSLPDDCGPVRRAVMHATLGSALLFAGDNTDAMAASQAGYELVAHRPLDEAGFDISLQYANGLLHTGRAAPGLELCLTALDWARTHGDPKLLAHSVYMAGGALMMAGRIDDAVSLFEGNMPEPGLGWSVQMAHVSSLSIALESFQGRARRGLDVLLPLLGEADLATKLNSFWWPLGCAEAAIAALACGEWDDADRYVWGHEFGAMQPEARDLRAVAVDILIERGRWDEARGLLDEIGEWMVGRGEFSAVSAHRARMRILQAGGRDIEAVEECIRSADALAGTSDEMYAGAILTAGFGAVADAADHARAARDNDRLAATLALGERLLQRASSLTAGPLGVTPAEQYARNRPQALQCRAEWARLQGVADLDVWRAAADAWGELEMPHPRGYCLWRAAEAGARAAAPRAEVAALLVEAYRIAVHLGAEPLCDETAALARRLRIRLEPAAERAQPTGPLDPDGFGLTERERDVLVLLADGRTNAQIGAELFISPRTVGIHVSHVLAKLQVGSRTEAARVAHSLGLLPLSGRGTSPASRP